MSMARLDEQRRRRHKLRNVVHSALLVGSLGLIAGAIGWRLAGPPGTLWVAVLISLTLVFSPTISPRAILRLYGARRISRQEFPELHDVAAVLAQRAGLSGAPELHYLATSMPNAFAVGAARNSAIVLTDGLLRAMDMRDLAGILAHEVSHIRNHDLWTMGLADIISRITGTMATAGVFLLLVSLPLMLAEHGTAHGPLIALLLVAPSINTLIQLRLSRTREFDADLDAVGLTGDPIGLASALAKLQRYDPGFWERILVPGRRNPSPSVLRTHPKTEERIERLLALQPLAPVPPMAGAGAITIPVHLAPPAHRPRWRLSGLWH